MVLTQQNIIQQVPQKQSFPLRAILKDPRRRSVLLDPSGVVLTVFSGPLIKSKASLPHLHPAQTMGLGIGNSHQVFAHAVRLILSGRIMPTPACGVVAAYLQSD